MCYLSPDHEIRDFNENLISIGVRTHMNLLECPVTLSMLAELKEGMQLSLHLGYNTLNTYYVSTLSLVKRPVITSVSPQNVNLGLATTIQVYGKWPETWHTPIIRLDESILVEGRPMTTTTLEFDMPDMSFFTG
jgi:hypothetical protein